MTLAERNWNYDLKTGNLGVMGNFFQKVKHISANHIYDPGDGLLCVDTTSAPITITLPPIANWPLQDYRIIIPIMHTAGLNGITLQLSGEETFLLGNTKFDLGSSVSAFDFYVINSETLSTYGILSDLTIKAVTSMTTDWASTNWATLAIMPFELEFDNTGPELFVYQSSGSGVIADATDYDETLPGTTLFGDEAHGLTVGQTITIAGTTSYNGIYEVVAVPDDDSFAITEAFVADESGTWVRYARYYIASAGLYVMSFTAQIDSTGGADWDATASIYIDDEIVLNTSVTVSGSSGENKSMNLIPNEYYIEAGSYLDVRIDNNTLTGNLTDAVLRLEMKAL